MKLGKNNDAKVAVFSGKIERLKTWLYGSRKWHGNL